MPTLTSVSGFPRIGEHRELKRAIEGYWKGSLGLDEMRSTARSLRERHWRLQADAGIDLIPSNDFSLYDQVLDTAMLLGAVPRRFDRLAFDHGEDLAFAMGRGYQGPRGDVEALPMKKWFTTNYHYLVPEIGEDTQIALSGTKPFDEYREAEAIGVHTKPVLVGPYTFLKLARDPQVRELELDRGIINAIATAYAEIVRTFADLGASWLQFDEPALVFDKTLEDTSLFKSLYAKILPARTNGVRIELNTYFGHIADIYDTVRLMGFDGIGLDLCEGRDANLAALRRHGVPQDTTIFAGVVSGRNIWRNDYADTLALLDDLASISDRVVVSSACSFLHVPYSTAGERELPAKVLDHFAFAVEKLGELTQLASLAGLPVSERDGDDRYQGNRALFDGTRVTADREVSRRIDALTDDDFVRTPRRDERRTRQHAALGLPVLPTTTIGSFPQTKAVRAERSDLRAGRITREAYDASIRRRIDEVVAHQERIGLDVLVHGEFERNDMVEYFGQHLNGFLFTSQAWVQSYGTRCVKPPIIWGDVSRREPITVRWSTYAQSRTTRPLKGMLTGPVTILNWSWPREDVPRSRQATQLALAIRDEVLDLERAGIRIIQIDEAALREKLPLRRSDWHTGYLDWAIPAFRLVHSGVGPTTQIHTHMCYSEFNDIIADIDAMDADVISFEASRGDLVVLDALRESRFRTEVGPGVYDIHSPRIPTEREIEDRLDRIVATLDPDRVWVNPDCGLKTRAEAETWPSLEHMVEAAAAVRTRLGRH